MFWTPSTFVVAACLIWRSVLPRHFSSLPSLRRDRSSFFLHPRRSAPFPESQVLVPPIASEPSMHTPPFQGSANRRFRFVSSVEKRPGHNFTLGGGIRSILHKPPLPVAAHLSLVASPEGAAPRGPLREGAIPASPLAIAACHRAPPIYSAIPRPPFYEGPCPRSHASTGTVACHHVLLGCASPGGRFPPFFIGGNDAPRLPFIRPSIHASSCGPPCGSRSTLQEGYSFTSTPGEAHASSFLQEELRPLSTETVTRYRMSPAYAACTSLPGRGDANASTGKRHLPPRASRLGDQRPYHCTHMRPVPHTTKGTRMLLQTHTCVLYPLHGGIREPIRTHVRMTTPRSHDSSYHLHYVRKLLRSKARDREWTRRPSILGSSRQLRG